MTFNVYSTASANPVPVDATALLPLDIDPTQFATIEMRLFLPALSDLSAGIIAIPTRFSATGSSRRTFVIHLPMIFDTTALLLTLEAP
jgi:hypothetical protein